MTHNIMLFWFFFGIILYYIVHMKENVSCRVSAYSCTFSSRHNNRPAPTMDRYTHWTSTSHLDKLNSERERGLGTQMTLLCLYTYNTHVT